MELARYPTGTLRPDDLRGKQYHLIDRTTLIGSMGSCFARHVKDYLISSGYNYVLTSEHPAARHGSAAWERVYSVPCLRQETERAFGQFRPEVTFFAAHGVLLSPYRSTVRWRDHEERLHETRQHEADARRALEACEVFIYTLGLSEYWVNPRDRAVAAQMPPHPERDDWHHVQSTVAETVLDLRRIERSFHLHNPGCHLVFTLSPVPLSASLSRSAIEGDYVSKATLRAALAAFLPCDGCSYFPAFELVRCVLRDPYEPDNRHVRPEAVAEVMQLFEWQYVQRP